MTRRNSDEIKVFGWNAVFALFRSRAEDLIRVYLLEENLKPLSPILKYCATKKKAYHIVPPEELDLIADSVHHEGVCVLARAKPVLTFSSLMDEISSDRRRAAMTLLLLEDVKNPHNVGAILRIAAHFGVRAVLLPGNVGSFVDRPPPSLLRIAEGGAEAVDFVSVRDTRSALHALAKEDFRSVATSSHAKSSIYQWSPPKRVVVLLGAENDGLSRGTLNTTEDLVSIPGTGAVESLNVATAAAIVLSEIYRAGKK
jgi:TrmH RNA methyltransferase